jgi:hypothetical protein
VPVPDVERERAVALASGFYGIFRSPGGILRVPVLAMQPTEARDRESDMREVTFSFDPDEVPRDPFGGVTLLGVFHERHQPEPEQPAW